MWPVTFVCMNSYRFLSLKVKKEQPIKKYKINWAALTSKKKKKEEEEKTVPRHCEWSICSHQIPM